MLLWWGKIQVGVSSSQMSNEKQELLIAHLCVVSYTMLVTPGRETSRAAGITAKVEPDALMRGKTIDPTENVDFH